MVYNSLTDPKHIVCIHEDRQSHMVGLKLAILSVQRHSPELDIVVSCPNPDDSFLSWVDKLSNIKLFSFPELGVVGWNIKPILLLKLLGLGYTEIIWMDSDIIVNGKILGAIAKFDSKTFVVAEEPYWGQRQGESIRTVSWGLKPRSDLLPTTINSGVVRVTQEHLQLLRAWQLMLSHPLYIKSQSIAGMGRPLHMIGDQEVLTALMGSTEFVDIPIIFLKRGRDIAQCFGAAGFTVSERLSCLFRFKYPSLFHAMGSKPWVKQSKPPSLSDRDVPILKRLRAYYEYISIEMSPYIIISRKYYVLLGDEAKWMNSNSKLSKFLGWFSFCNPSLQGLVLAVIDSIGKGIRAKLGVDRFPVNSDFVLTESPLLNLSLEENAISSG